MPLITNERWPNGFYGKYNGAALAIERDHKKSDWYILVTDKEGFTLYDGWWKNSAGKPLSEAIQQALIGSKLISNDIKLQPVRQMREEA